MIAKGSFLKGPFFRSLNVTAACINEIVRERRGISADTALRLARYFKTDVQSGLNWQANYDLQCAEDAARRAISRIRPYTAQKNVTVA